MFKRGNGEHELPEEALTREAAVWYGRITADQPSKAVYSDFEDWLAADHRHQRAYEQVQASSRLTRSLYNAPAIKALRRESLRRVLVARPNRVWRTAATAVSLLVIGAGALFHLFSARPLPADPGRYAQPAIPILRTKVGERMTALLPDGSTVLLNTDSRIRVAYTGKERRLVLNTGEALFEVAKGDPRPFVVIAGDREIVAHGTQFNVRVKPDELQVALLEGRVSVGRAGYPPADEVRMSPNDVLVTNAKRTSIERMDNISELTSWRDGYVTFDHTRLADAAAEMNRYLDRPQLVIKPSASAIMVSGVFRMGRTADFVDAVLQAFPVKVTEKSADQIVLSR